MEKRGLSWVFCSFSFSVIFFSSFFSFSFFSNFFSTCLLSFSLHKKFSLYFFSWFSLFSFTPFPLFSQTLIFYYKGLSIYTPPLYFIISYLLSLFNLLYFFDFFLSLSLYPLVSWRGFKTVFILTLLSLHDYRSTPHLFLWFFFFDFSSSFLL